MDTALRLRPLGRLLVLFFLSSCSCQIIMQSSDPSSHHAKKPNRDYSSVSNDGSAATCADSYSFKKGSVIQVSKSEKLGGRLLNATSGLTSGECLKRCCHTPRCTVAAFEQQGRLACYLFDCGDVDDFRCELVPYSDYEVAILTVSRQELAEDVQAKDIKTPEPVKSMARTLSQLRDSSPVCSRYEFQCHTSGDCIAAYDRCNGAYECPDRSDEANCDEFRQEQYRLAQEKELQNSQHSPAEQDLEDELRSHNTDDAGHEPQLWDRGRNRIVTDATPAPLARTSTEIRNFQPATAMSSHVAPSLASQSKMAARIQVPTTTTPTAALPLDRIATTISIVSTTDPHDIQQIHVEKHNATFTFPEWLNFSDPSHFVISVVLIMAIGFCMGMTLFVVCRCLCNRNPKVTKYRIVDPESEDFLLGGTYG